MLGVTYVRAAVLVVHVVTCLAYPSVCRAGVVASSEQEARPPAPAVLIAGAGPSHRDPLLWWHGQVAPPAAVRRQDCRKWIRAGYGAEMPPSPFSMAQMVPIVTLHHISLFQRIQTGIKLWTEPTSYETSVKYRNNSRDMQKSSWLVNLKEAVDLNQTVL